VGRLVLGGVAARLDRRERRVGDARLHLEVVVLSGRLCLTVGPFAADPLADSAIRRVVAPLVDEVDSRVTSEGHHAVLTVLLSEQPAE
jgi:hypothetical protein